MAKKSHIQTNRRKLYIAAVIFLLPPVSDLENFKCLIFVAHA